MAARKEMSGYIEADRIDRAINKILERYPVKENVREYMTFARTIRTTIDIIDKTIQDELDKKGVK